MSNDATSDTQPIHFESLSQRDRRALIFHILYIAESNDYTVSIASVIDNLNRGYDLDIPYESDLAETCSAVVDQRQELDAKLKPFLTNWRFDRIGVATKLILRYAIWELGKGDTHAHVVINEAIELAKAFGEKDSYKFINGILDEFVKRSGSGKQDTTASSSKAD